MTATDIEERIKAFADMGKPLSEDLEAGKLDEVIHRAYVENHWFTEENIKKALRAVIANFLDKDNLKEWVSRYPIGEGRPKTVGIVMAGNIPLVGWHDLMTVILAGHKAMVKLSSKDKILQEMMIRYLFEAAPKLKDRVEVVDLLKNFDAVIATGSNNTARYFEYYFGKYPHIIRKNRTSVAVLTGAESRQELEALGSDIFTYFGLGCRNVSKLYVPQGYDLRSFFEAIEPFAYVGDHTKYRNNYDYYKSISLLNKELHFDNGFLLLKQSDATASAVSVILYEHYDNLTDLNMKLALLNEDIQCIVSEDRLVNNAIRMGETQDPKLWDYADGVDTMKFLTELN